MMFVISLDCNVGSVSEFYIATLYCIICTVYMFEYQQFLWVNIPHKFNTSSFSNFHVDRSQKLLISSPLCLID